MQALSSILTLRPTDLITVGRSMANVGSGVAVGLTATFSVMYLAHMIIDPESKLVQGCLVAGAALAGFTATYLFAPQVAIPLASAKVAQVAILTALVAFGVSCTQDPRQDKIKCVLVVGLLPTIGIIGTFLGGYAALTGGAIAATMLGYYFYEELYK